MNQTILDAFQMMWGPFPEPVLLIKKDRTILAANRLATSLGVSTGVKCFSNNPNAKNRVCPNCRANEALREGKTIREDEEHENGATVLGYWMPLEQEPDVYVHFGFGSADLMDCSAK